MRSNIVLIGMPGSGKSTTGVILAKKMAYGFLDTDLMIELKHGASLETLLSRHGYLGLRRIEEEILLELECSHHVLATGGSAIYSAKAMRHLAKSGVIIYLEAEADDIARRVGDLDQRGVARPPEHSINDVFAERVPLYESFAEIRIVTRFKTQDQVAAEIAAFLEGFKGG